MSKGDSDWEKIVLVAVVILAIIALFKFLFWVSIVAIAVGIIWLIFNVVQGDHDNTWIPAILVVGGIIAAIVSYQIGYGFEKSEFGKPIVDGAKAIVQTDNTIKEVEQNVTNQILDATAQAAADVNK
jgi:hypothetical protein